MQNITLQTVKSQIVTVTLSGQSVTLRIVQRASGLYMDVGIDNTWIAQGVLCLNGNKIIRYSYLKFRGELFFADTKSNADPMYDELGTRFKLFYATPEEMTT